MRYDKFRNLPTKGTVSECPQCDKTLIAKCGNRKVHHWAHKSLIDCDPWWEPMSEWHLNWQEKVAPEFREIKMANHRADVQLPNGRVVEFQYSSLSEDEVFERENFYNELTWVWDARKFQKNFTFWEKDATHTFYWRRPRHHIATCTKTVYLDFGETIFKVKKFNPKEIERN